MILVTLDLTCTICGSEQFHLPRYDSSSQHVRCANCRAFKCYAKDLERAMIALNRAKRDRAA